MVNLGGEFACFFLQDNTGILHAGSRGQQVTRSTVVAARSSIAARASRGMSVSAFTQCACMSEWQKFDIFEVKKMTDQPLALVGPRVCRLAAGAGKIASSDWMPLQA